MGAWAYVCGSGVTANIDRDDSLFMPIAGNNVGFTVSATESFNQIQARAAYTWSNIGARVIANNLDGATLVHARLGGADQAPLQISIGANSTGFFEDDTGSVSVSDGDLINYRIASGSGAHGDAIQITCLSGALDAAGLERPICIVWNPTIDWEIIETNTEFTMPVGNVGGGTTTEGDTQYTLRQDVDFSNLRITVTANTLDAAATVDLREDGASSANLTISVPANTTGSFEDTDTEAISSGSTISYRTAAPASGKTTDFIGVTGLHMLMQGDVKGRIAGIGDSDPVAQLPGTTNYFPFEGDTDTEGATESDTQVEAPVAFEAHNMIVKVVFNDLSSAATTFAFRVNSADSPLGISVSAGATGLFEDTTNTVSVALDDDIDWEIAVASGGTGSIRTHLVALQMDTPSMPLLQPLQGIYRVTAARAY